MCSYIYFLHFEPAVNLCAVLFRIQGHSPLITSALNQAWNRTDMHSSPEIEKLWEKRQFRKLSVSGIVHPWNEAWWSLMLLKYEYNLLGSDLLYLIKYELASRFSLSSLPPNTATDSPRISATPTPSVSINSTFCRLLPSSLPALSF